MKSTQRIISTINGEKVDHIPVAPQLFGFTARQAGVGIGKYVREGETLARCQLKSRDRFGTDAVFAVSDVNVEAEAAGCELTYFEDDYPVISVLALSSPLSIDGLEVPAADRDGRMPEMLAAVRKMSSSLGGACPVIGTVMGPMTQAGLLLGLENALFLAHDDPRSFSALLRRSAEIGREYGRAQLRAGADVIMVFDPSAAPVVFPKDLFFRFEEELLKELQTALTLAGGKVPFLHIAAYTAPIMEHIRPTGTRLFCFDQSTGISEVEEHLPGVCMIGNINIMTLLDGSPSLVKADCERLLEDFRERGRLILSSACEVPPATPSSNILAMVCSARDWK
jgi:uroporphyrinogen decarboxylase